LFLSSVSSAFGFTVQLAKSANVRK
jgi:hypothetical protein